MTLERYRTDCGGGICTTVGSMCDGCMEEGWCSSCSGTGHGAAGDEWPCGTCGGTGRAALEGDKP